MLKKIALAGLFATVSVVSVKASSSTPTRSAPSLPKVESQPMRGGPCMPGIPRC